MDYIKDNHPKDVIPKYYDINKLEEYVNIIHSLTNYPKDAIIDIMRAIVLTVLEEVADTVIDAEEFPESIKFEIPLFGEVTVERLISGRTGDFMYTFKPAYNFKESLEKAFYEGKTPLMDLAKLNIDQIMEFRSGNIIIDE